MAHFPDKYHMYEYKIVNMYSNSDSLHPWQDPCSIQDQQFADTYTHTQPS